MSAISNSALKEAESGGYDSVVMMAGKPYLLQGFMAADVSWKSPNVWIQTIRPPYEIQAHGSVDFPCMGALDRQKERGMAAYNSVQLRYFDGRRWWCFRRGRLKRGKMAKDGEIVRARGFERLPPPKLTLSLARSH